MQQDQAGRPSCKNQPGGAVLVFGFAFLFDVEAEVFEEGDLAGLHVGAGGFDFEADAIFKKTDRRAEGIFHTVHLIAGAHTAFNKTTNILK
jgi:hypothetical protein